MPLSIQIKLVERKTIKINIQNYNRLMDLKEVSGYRSLNETLENILPSGAVHNAEFTNELPAFEIMDNEISWNTLKKSEVNACWKSDDNNESVL